MSKKPSFFEKLTGSNWADSKNEFISDEEEKPFKSKTVSKKKKIIKKDFFPEEENRIPDSRINKAIEDEDILTESEGQLTIDVYQTDDEVIIKSTIAGVRPQDIDISMIDDTITIKGNRKKDEEIPEKNYYYQECYWGPFSRSVILPVDVEANKVKATMKNGILTVKLPKIEKTKAKKIEIIAE